ncbi:MAG TPA: hypothetical protein VF017_14155 [Thermoanaerobaculia bacterium]|nr:hypothetical protein [Thermoanaerobaculia bacterium]
MVSIEEWLEDSTLAWRAMTKREFIDFFRDWQECFEPLFREGRWAAEGIDAMNCLEGRLPFDAAVFCVPGYRFAPADTRQPFFAYYADRLAAIDRDLCNSHDVTIADRSLGFCCFFTHEFGGLSEPKYWERDRYEELGEQPSYHNLGGVGPPVRGKRRSRRQVRPGGYRLRAGRLVAPTANGWDTFSLRGSGFLDGGSAQRLLAAAAA